jgi:hypothetical protein
MTQWVGPVGVKALPRILAPPAKKKKWGAKDSQRTSVWRALHSTSGRGCGCGSMKAMDNRVLFDVEVGASDELPLLVRQSFKDGQYYPSTEMEEERECQIMLEQFIAPDLL